MGDDDKKSEFKMSVTDNWALQDVYVFIVTALESMRFYDKNNKSGFMLLKDVEMLWKNCQIHIQSNFKANVANTNDIYLMKPLYYHLIMKCMNKPKWTL